MNASAPFEYRFPIVAFANYDGDSIDLTLDVGFGLRIHRKCRLNGVDTPELRGGTDASRAAARLAKDYTATFCATAGAVFVSETYTGKFGRPLGDVRVGSRSLCGELLARRLAVPYAGQAKADIADQHEANIAYLKDTGRI